MGTKNTNNNTSPDFNLAPRGRLPESPSRVCEAPLCACYRPFKRRQHQKAYALQPESDKSRAPYSPPKGDNQASNGIESCPLRAPGVPETRWRDPKTTRDTERQAPKTGYEDPPSNTDPNQSTSRCPSTSGNTWRGIDDGKRCGMPRTTWPAMIAMTSRVVAGASTAKVIQNCLGDIRYSPVLIKYERRKMRMEGPFSFCQDQGRTVKDTDEVVTPGTT